MITLTIQTAIVEGLNTTAGKGASTLFCKTKKTSPIRDQNMKTLLKTHETLADAV